MTGYYVVILLSKIQTTIAWLFPIYSDHAAVKIVVMSKIVFRNLVNSRQVIGRDEWNTYTLTPINLNLKRFHYHIKNPIFKMFDFGILDMN